MDKHLCVDKFRSLGRNDPLTLASVNDLAGILYEIGDLVSAEAFYEGALIEKEQVFGPDHESTLLAVNNLAQVIKSTGRIEEAKVN
jgi:hypothetical protein